MSIYLVQVDYSRFFSQEIVPIGCLHVGSALKNAGYEVKVIHCTELEIDRYVDEIVKAQPLWVGFSAMTGPQTMHSAWMSKRVKAQSDIPVVWGGIHPSLLPEQCLQEDYIDFVIIGEGEETALELTQRLEGRKDLEGVLGLGYKRRENGQSKAVINPRRPFIQDLDDDKYRLNFELLDVPRYFLKAGTGKYQRVFSYKTSRGCPFSCGFCYNNEFNLRRWRGKSAEGVIEDINYLKKTYGIDGVKFYDDEFYVNRKRALKILECIGIPAKTDIRIDMITEDLAARLKEFNVFDILIGIESGSDRILKLLNKGITVEQTKRGVRLLAKHTLRVGYSAIIGIPTETEEEMNSTIDLILWIHSIHKNKSVTIGPYLPYPGSALYHWTMKQGFVPPRKTEDWGLIDRWRKDLYKVLPWVRDDYIYYLREYMKFFNYDIAPISKLAELRLRHRFVKFPLDVALVHFLYDQAIPEKNWFGRFLRKAHRVLKD
ncbi:MAG: radical SAM protein [Candidatus Brocadiaceae bacterium]|nr:radical SAM protein [Candidatus Brocadiaceae bacterium]